VHIVWKEIVREKDNIIEEPLVFNKILVSFTAQFKADLRLFDVNSTHLKRNSGGVSLSVATLDGNNGLFPILMICLT